MVGCRYNAKNTLDKNYLYLAEKECVTVMENSRVISVIPIGKQGNQGYEILIRRTGGFKKIKLHTRSFIFSGGVLGSVPLLLKLKKTTLPDLSDLTGAHVRTIGVYPGVNPSLTITALAERAADRITLKTF